MGAMVQLIIFWYMGSTCSLIQNSIAEALNFPGKSVHIMIMTINRQLFHEAKLFFMELINCYSDCIIIKAFGV